MVQPYSYLCRLDPSKGSVREKEVELCSSFLRRNNLSTEIKSERIDSELLSISRDQQESVEALLCLRCRTSHPINAQINALYRNNRKKYEIDLD